MSHVHAVWWRLGPSAIHGTGVFAERLIRKGETISRPPGDNFRGYNHSCNPNLGDRVDNPTESIILRVVLRDIQPGEEVTVNYGPTSRIVREGLCGCPLHTRTPTHAVDNLCGCAWCSPSDNNQGSQP